MNVGQLKAKLNEIPDDWPIILSFDRDEQSGFGQLAAVEEARWDEQQANIKLFELTEKQKQQGYTEEDYNPNLPPAIVLWP
jgi:hypothetical protein